MKADPQRHPALASQLVFVPTIGFRPLGTRTLREPAQTVEDDVYLSVLVIAAAPDRTDILVEWEWTPNAATCPPIVASLMSREPLERTLTAAVMIGTSTIEPTRWGPRSLTSQGFARSTLTFPPLPGETPDAMLRVADGAREWRVPFVLVPGQAAATALAVHAERDGVVVRATALAHHADELTVGLEAEAAWQIRQVGAPIPTGPSFSRDSAESLRNKRQEFRRHFAARASPIVLEDDRGGRLEEIGRLFLHDPQQTTTGGPFQSRFSVVFDAPNADAATATLVVPFVELNDPEHSVTADLRALPRDLRLGEYRFSVVKAEPHRANETRVFLQIPRSASSPRFVQPRQMRGAGPDDFAWQRAPEGEELISMTTTVGDPPAVTFEGAVLRVDGPFRLAIPLH